MDSDSDSDDVRIHIERRGNRNPRPRVRFALPQVFPGHTPFIPGRNVVVNNFRRDESPSSTSSSDYDRPSRRRARRNPSPARARANRMVWETELMRNQMLQLQLQQERDADERRLVMKLRDQDDMRRARRELRQGKERESLAEIEKRAKEEFERELLEKKLKEKEAKEKREKEVKEAIEKYKLEEAEKTLKEMEEKEKSEKAYKAYLEQHLALSGIDEKHVIAIMNRERIDANKPLVVVQKHPCPEALRAFTVDYDYDPLDEGKIIVEHVAPDWELDRHTRHIHRRPRCGVDDKLRFRHCKEEVEIIKTRKRKHGKKVLPWLMYLAGYR